MPSHNPAPHAADARANHGAPAQHRHADCAIASLAQQLARASCPRPRSCTERRRGVLLHPSIWRPACQLRAGSRRVLYRQDDVRRFGGGGGYLYARAKANGFRFSGLYVRSRNRGLIFFYKAVGSSAQKSATFATSVLGGGVQHSLVFSVAGTTATLAVDSVAVGSQTLEGFVDNCGAPGPECITHVGQRQRGYPMAGCVAAASVEPAAPAAFDLLNPEIHDSAVAPVGGNVYCFERGSTPGLELGRFPPSSSTFSLRVNFRVSQKASGYLVAKGAGGKSRYFSVYIRRSDQTVVMYYRAVGSSRQRSVALTGPGVVGENSLLVTVSGASATAHLVRGSDGVETTTVSLDGPVDDCDAPGKKCTFHVGQREGGLELNSGCIFEAFLYPGMVVAP